MGVWTRDGGGQREIATESERERERERGIGDGECVCGREAQAVCLSVWLRV